MMTKCLIYLSFFGALYFLPDRVWEICFQKILTFFERLRTLNERFYKNSESWPFVGEEKRGQKLLAVFPEFEVKISLGVKNLNIRLPQYKFYTGLILNLLETHRRCGISLKSILPELRTNLITDLSFEKKIMGQFFGGNLQFIVVTCTTWCFVFLSSVLAELPFRLFDLGIIVLLQVAAFMVFNFSFLKLKKRAFGEFNLAIERLYLFSSLCEIGYPINQVLSESRILGEDLIESKAFRAYGERLTSLVKRWKESGFSPKVYTSEMIKEIWQGKEMNFTRFLKQLELLKFSVLAFFFLPAYFYYLFSIFQFFMEQ